MCWTRRTGKSYIQVADRCVADWEQAAAKPDAALEQRVLPAKADVEVNDHLLSRWSADVPSVHQFELSSGFLADALSRFSAMILAISCEDTTDVFSR